MLVEQAEIGLDLEVEDDLPDQAENYPGIPIANIGRVIVHQFQATTTQSRKGGGQVADMMNAFRALGFVDLLQNINAFVRINNVIVLILPRHLRLEPLSDDIEVSRPSDPRTGPSRDQRMYAANRV